MIEISYKFCTFLYLIFPELSAFSKCHGIKRDESSFYIDYNVPEVVFETSNCGCCESSWRQYLISFMG